MLMEPLTSLREPKMRVELDKRALFALASDTRLDILKSLQPMRRTVTQLADTLGIDKAAIHRHLKTLEEGGFVKRYEDHGFVYYGLSWKSRDLLSPNENTRVVILLSTFIILIGVTILIFASAIVDSDLYDWGPSRGLSPSDSDAEQDYSMDMAGDSVLLLPLLLAGVMVSIISAVALFVAVRMIRRPRQPGMTRDQAD